MIYYMNMGSYRCCKYPTTAALSLKRLIPLFKVIGEESRMKILIFLSMDKHCVQDLMKHTKDSQSLISHHLYDLKKAGIIANEKIGLRVYYSLTEWGKSIVSTLTRIRSKKVIS